MSSFGFQLRDDDASSFGFRLQDDDGKSDATAPPVHDEYRQQNGGYDMGHTGANATLVDNTDLAELRRKARLLDWLASQKMLNVLRYENRCMLTDQNIKTFAAPTLVEAIESAIGK